MKRQRLFLVFVGFLLAATNTIAVAAKFNIEVAPRVVGPNKVEVNVTSNIPGTVEVMLSLDLAGQKPTDTYIGVSKRIALKTGTTKTVIGKPDLPAGKYYVEVSFYPKWGPKDEVAKQAGAKFEIHARKLITLKGSGQSAHAVVKRKNDQSWVMKNVGIGTRWNYSYWVKRFGSPEQLRTTRWNPKIIKAYYFKSLDMTIFVNVLKHEVAIWRLGRKTE